MKVLVGTDGSDDALDAARQGLALLATADAVVVVCAVDVPFEATAGMESGFAGGIASPAAVDSAWAAVSDEAAAAIDATVAVLPAGVSVERLVETGRAGDVLCRLAGELACDAVVVGSRGRGAVRRALLGSVSTDVVSNAPCPVVVVRSGVSR